MLPAIDVLAQEKAEAARTLFVSFDSTRVVLGEGEGRSTRGLIEASAHGLREVEVVVGARRRSDEARARGLGEV